jgi:hypothetical protein
MLNADKIIDDSMSITEISFSLDQSKNFASKHKGLTHVPLVFISFLCIFFCKNNLINL